MRQGQWRLLEGPNSIVRGQGQAGSPERVGISAGGQRWRRHATSCVAHHVTDTPASATSAGPDCKSLRLYCCVHLYSLLRLPPVISSMPRDRSRSATPDRRDRERTRHRDRSRSPRARSRDKDRGKDSRRRDDDDYDRHRRDRHRSQSRDRDRDQKSHRRRDRSESSERDKKKYVPVYFCIRFRYI